MTNPLLSDRDVAFLLQEVLDLPSLLALPAYAEHTPETLAMYVQSTRDLARRVLFPAYRAMDQEPPTFEGGRVRTHPAMTAIYPRLVELGVLTATRPPSVGGANIPTCVAALANVYLMAANLGAYGYAGLTTGAARLLETFGNDALKARFMSRLYAGEWAGTMALTEPQAGSSLADVTTLARPRDDGSYAIRGSKIFISGGDQGVTPNVIHLTLARIEGAPPGIKGISLFAIPRLRERDDANADGDASLVPNDVTVTGLIHKIGWRGLPSVALNFGDDDDCRGWLVGEPHRGLAYMFQMMNEARLMVGLNGVATASVAYHESLAYAKTRTQGRKAGASREGAARGGGALEGGARSPVAIIEHADVRRMLLRQKAIVEGGLALLVFAAREQDLSEHAASPEAREEARLFLDFLTPIAKTFPAERGFEANALALQIHGGYGYSSEYLPEAWLRDQKLNTIHEGTSGIQGIDLLGRKAGAAGGAGLRRLAKEIEDAAIRAEKAGVPSGWTAHLRDAMATLGRVSMTILTRPTGELLRHSADYLELASIVVVGWQWVTQAAIAKEALAKEASAASAAGSSESDRAFYEGKLAAAQYWLVTECTKAAQLGRLCEENDDAYERMAPDWF